MVTSHRLCHRYRFCFRPCLPPRYWLQFKSRYVIHAGPTPISARSRRQGQFGLSAGRFVRESLMPLILEALSKRSIPRGPSETSRRASDRLSRVRSVQAPRPAVFARAPDRVVCGAKIYFKTRRAESHWRAQDQSLIGQVLLRQTYGKTRSSPQDRRRHAMRGHWRPFCGALLACVRGSYYGRYRY